MTRYATDASVVGKWFLSERDEEHALRLRSAEHSLIAPDLLLPELGNLLLRAFRRGMIPQSLIRPAVDDVRDVVSVFDASRLMDEAIEIALRYQRSAYDALYVALALQEGCPLVTADRRLYDAVAVELPGVVLWIEDVP